MQISFLKDAISEEIDVDCLMRSQSMFSFITLIGSSLCHINAKFRCYHAKPWNVLM